MIYKILGKVEQIDENQICVTTSDGVSYEINCTLADAENLTKDNEIKTVYTYLQVREDALVLFGFSSLNVKATGAAGQNGTNGNDGATPEIKEGYWYINNQSTGVKALGVDGIAETHKADTEGISGV